MVRLPELSTYTASDWATATKLSPAVARYKTLLDRPHSDEHGDLRKRRHDAWLTAAMATLLERSHPENVCMYWSERADEILATAWRLAGLSDAPLVVAALGKHGSCELNLSSDIDLLYVANGPIEQKHMHGIKKFRSLMEDVTEFGFCFRLDHDLRPGGRLGPLISNLPQIQNYFWSQAMPWERLAMVRFRAIIGQNALKDEVTETVQSFTYRRHLDYSLLETLSELRQKIHATKKNSKLFNLKTDPGGIRDIELFVHAMQVLNGGKKTDLRTTSTGAAIDMLIHYKVLDKKDLAFLRDAYWKLRHLENWVQIIHDEQIYEFDPHRSELSSVRSKYQDVERNRERVEGIVKTVLGEASGKTDGSIQTAFDFIDFLKKNGFDEDCLHTTGPHLFEQIHNSRSSQAEHVPMELLKKVIEDFVFFDIDRSFGLRRFLEFCQRNRMLKNFLALLNEHPNLRRDFSLILTASPDLGGIFVNRPELLDSFLYRLQDYENLDEEELLENLAERRQMAEIASTLQFLKNNDLKAMSEQLSQNADETIRILCASLEGSSKAPSFDVLALGKWGGRELGLKSDLDFIFVTDETPTEAHFKLAKRVIARLTEPHKGGSIYNVDLRLRPSGQAGPLLVTRERLDEYLQKEAQAWERQSYLRARWIMKAGGPPIASFIERGLSDDDLRALKDIRARLMQTASSDGYDLKLSPGGLIDVELSVQTKILKQKISPIGTSTEWMIESLSKALPHWANAKSELLSTYQSLRMIEQLHQIFSGTSGSVLKPGTQGWNRLIRFLKIEDQALSGKIETALDRNRQILNLIDPLQKVE